MVDEVSPYILNDITQIVTALGVILTAVSSIMNRLALNRLHKENQDISKATADKVEAVKLVAQAGVQATRQAVEKVEEVKQAAVAVNAEVVAKIHEAGVEAGKAIAINGKNGHDSDGS